MQQVILLVGAKESQQAIQAAQLTTEILKNNVAIKQISSRTSTQDQQAIGKLFYQHRYHLLSDNDAKILKSQGAEYFAQSSLQLLFSPLSGQLAELMLSDPFLLSYRFLNNQQMLSSKQNIVDGYLVVAQENKSFVLLNIQLNQSPFLPQVQAAIRESIDQITQKWKEQQLDITLLKTGPVFYAEYAVNNAKQEISTIGLGSLVAIILLLIICFVSLRPILLTSLAVGFGILSAFTFVHWLYGSIHLLTLVFGASLIGVAVDYAFSLFCQQQ